jgi:hypothetical protein
MNRVMYRVKYDSILGITEISLYPQHLTVFEDGMTEVELSSASRVENLI